MSKFDTYFLMGVQDVIEYAKEKLDFFNGDSSLSGKEIGDGNLNYVYRVWDENSSRSVIVKQAGHSLRISEDMKISVDRNRIESEILLLQDKFAPGMVPKIYDYDTVMCACFMEDLTGHVIMREALMNGEIFPDFAEDITTFMVNTLLPTTDVVMGHKEKKALVKNYINPELCEITEELVYTEPYNNMNGRNNVFPPVSDFVQKELYDDGELHLEVAKLKFDFMNNAQALLHGDLHTGSVFIKQGSTKVIDPEFAFYGPIGYDVGNVIANLEFAYLHAGAVMGNSAQKTEFMSWVEETIERVVDLFILKFNKFYDLNVTEPMAKVKGFREAYLASVLSDTAAVTGLELNRRIVGMANVKDITCIEDEAKRARAEKICITAAKGFIKKRGGFRRGADFLAEFKKAEAKF